MIVHLAGGAHGDHIASPVAVYPFTDDRAAAIEVSGRWDPAVATASIFQLFSTEMRVCPSSFEELNCLPALEWTYGCGFRL